MGAAALRRLQPVNPAGFERVGDTDRHFPPRPCDGGPGAQHALEHVSDRVRLDRMEAIEPFLHPGDAANGEQIGYSVLHRAPRAFAGHHRLHPDLVPRPYEMARVDACRLFRSNRAVVQSSATCCSGYNLPGHGVIMATTEWDTIVKTGRDNDVR